MADQLTARQRAREAQARLLESRAEQDRRIMDATSSCYEARDEKAAAEAALLAAEAKLAKGLEKLRTDENQSLAAIAGLTGLEVSEVRRLLPARPKPATVAPAADEAGRELVAG